MMEGMEELLAECGEEVIGYIQEAIRNLALLAQEIFVSRVKNIYCETHRELEKITQKRATMKSIPICKINLYDGDKLDKRKLYRDAVGLYTRGLASAPDGSKEIVFAYLSRSEANMRDGRLIDCLLDVNRALKERIPYESTQRRLTRLKELCEVKMRASEQYVHYEGNETDPINATNTDDDEVDKEFSSRCNFNNTLIPCASSKIKLEYDDRKWGRHIVATEDIEPGEILASQEFFVSQSEQEISNFQYCSYCYADCGALLPCSSCCFEMYCSTRCQQRAKELYHDMECKFFAHMMKSPPRCSVWFWKRRHMKSLIFEAHRTLLIGTKKGTGLKNLMKKLDMSEIFAENVDLGNEPFDDYLAVLRMSRTFDFDMLTNDMITWILHAVVALRHTGYFEAAGDNSAGEETEKDSLSKMELFTTMLLANHVMTLPFNEFLGGSSDPVLQGKIVLRYVVPLENYINHSCEPNIRNLTRKSSERVIFAVRTIKKGEQIFDSYCSIFTDQSLEDRQPQLKAYGFDCQCDACLYNWPPAYIASSEEKQFLRDCKEGTIRHQPIFCYEREKYFRIELPILRLRFELESVVSEIDREPQLFNTVQRKCKILQVLVKIRRWYDKDGVPIELKKPLMLIMECEEGITWLMRLLFEDLNGKLCSNMRLAELLESLHEFIIWLKNYMSNFLTLHQKKYSNIDLFE